MSYPYTPHIVETPPRSTIPDGEPLPANLRDVVDRCQGITETQRETLAALVREYSDVFSIDGEIGACDWVLFEIDTQGHPPVREPVRPVPVHHREEVKEIFQGYLKQGIARYSTSEWNSPLVVVKKIDG